MLENLSIEQVHVSGYKTSLIKTPTSWIVVLVTRRGGGGASGPTGCRWFVVFE